MSYKIALDREGWLTHIGDVGSLFVSRRKDERPLIPKACRQGSNERSNLPRRSSVGQAGHEARTGLLRKQLLSAKQFERSPRDPHKLTGEFSFRTDEKSRAAVELIERKFKIKGRNNVARACFKVGVVAVLAVLGEEFQ